MALTLRAQAEAHLRSAEQAQDAKLLTESEQKVKSLRHKLEQLRTNARTATLNERAHYNRLVMGVVTLLSFSIHLSCRTL